MIERYICDDCYDCYWYWRNNDTEDECQGAEELCHEFVSAERFVPNKRGEQE